VFDDIFDLAGWNPRHVVPPKSISAPVGGTGKETADGEDSHDGVHPTILLSGLLHTLSNLVTNLTDPIVLRSPINLASEPLEERAVYTVLCHPIKVPTNRI
jgi:hypothetical protein